jgi:hypothetical protein
VEELVIGIAFLFLGLVFIAIVIVILLVAIGAVALGVGTSALAVGGIAGSSRVKNPLVRKTLVVGFLTVLFFGIICLLLVGALLLFDFSVPIVIAAAALGLGMCVTSVLGIRFSLTFEREILKVLLIILFVFTLIIGLVMTALSVAAVMGIITLFG